MFVENILKRDAVKYEILSHKPVYSAQKIAQVEHVSGMNVAKPVVITADGQYHMCVLAACCKIDLNALRTIIMAKEVRLVSEDVLEKLFLDCELGAEPPFGSFYGMPTLLDERLMQDEFIIFQAGTHDKCIKMNLQEYLKIEMPRIHSFSYHV